MRTISVSEAKATLSEQIRHVSRGEEVIILDRGHAVAKLVSCGAANRDSELQSLAEAGLVRLGDQPLSAAFWDKPRPRDPKAQLRAAVQAEREEGW